MCNVTVFLTDRKAFHEFKNIEKIIISYSGFGISDVNETVLSTDDEMINFRYETNIAGQFHFFSSTLSATVDGKKVSMIEVEKITESSQQ